MKKSSILFVLGIILCLLGYFYFSSTDEVVRNANKSKVKITVGIATWPGFAPGYIANEKHFFGEEIEVEFKIIDDFVARQNAFTSGHTQATISTIDSYAFESAQGVDGKVIMVLDESFGGDGIIASPEIKMPSDLKGRKVAYTRGSPAHYFLIQYLRKENVKLSDIISIQVDDPGKAGEAFLSGTVDAAVTWEPYISQIIGSKKGVLLESTKTAPEFIVDVMVFNDDFLVKNEKAVKSFVEGWYQAVDYIKVNPDEAFGIMSSALTLPKEELQAMASGLKFADKSRSQYFLLPNGGISKSRRIFEDASEVWLNEGLIKSTSIYKQHFNASFIED